MDDDTGSPARERHPYDTQGMLEMWAAARDETLDLGERLANLDNDQWNAASLCAAWRVRDVLAHVVAGAEGAFRGRAVVGGLLRYRFDFNAWIAADGRARGQEDPPDILRAFIGTASCYTVSPKGAPIRALTHVLVHGQDICCALGIRRELPEVHLRPVAGFVATSVIFRAKKHVGDVKLIATDMDWSHGAGPEVTGPAEALIMVMAGRTAVLDELSGEGLPTIRSALTR